MPARPAAFTATAVAVPVAVTSPRDGEKAMARVCPSCRQPVDEQGATLAECAAGRFGTDDPHCCCDCGGCFCDGAC